MDPHTPGRTNVTRRIREEDLLAIEEAVQRHPEGATARQIHEVLEAAPPRRTLQYRLRSLVDAKRLAMDSSGRWARYRVPETVDAVARVVSGVPTISVRVKAVPSWLTETALEIRNRVRQPSDVRYPVGYDRAFLDSYRPDDTFYLSDAERSELWEIGRAPGAQQPAGTHAKHVLNRLLIDLSWNSSRLEGNTYSLLDTARLIEVGEEAEGKDQREAQMILNHKDAIEFLVDAAEDIGFNRYTILNLHAALADNLLPNPEAAGRLRHIVVEIGGSVFHPLGVPQLIEECFDLILAKASAIEDPFEQAFFALVQLPYLQPFDDVNKRTSRLAANIPLIKQNLSPLSFEDVSRDLYTEAILGVYELNRTELLRDTFLWAYNRSAARYGAVRQSMGEPDPFRMKHRTALRKVVGVVIREHMDKKQATLHVSAWARGSVDDDERQRFCEIAEKELLGMHEGNFARYGIRPTEFAAWRARWNA